MRDRDLRALLLSALAPAPDFSRLSVLHRTSTSRVRRLLRWLDQSGLALYLFTQLQEHDALDQVPVHFREALECRLRANQARTQAMLAEFARLVESFHRNGVRFAALKGFTLTPAFCPAPNLRHQTDFDFLVAPDSLENAKSAMQACGYGQQENGGLDEATFATPLRHIPSPKDNIYAIPEHREVDIVTTLHQAAHGVSIELPMGVLDRVETRTLHGISFPALPATEMFCLQVMHAFKHLLGSWVRASWLFEIAYFIDKHYGQDHLWHAIADRMGRDAKRRNAFGLVLSLTNRLWPRPIPRTLADWCLPSLPPSIEVWVAYFGIQTTVADLDGAKLTLFVHREFVDDRNHWNSYLSGRIFPVGRHASIGTVTNNGSGTRIKAKMAQWRHIMRRSIFHAQSIFSLPVQAIRWKYALRSIERQRVQVSQALSR
jgi:Uncharacterised nucleotidyltransferase